MNNIVSAAEDYLNADLSVIPVNANKRPALESWSQYQDNAMSIEFAAKAFKMAKGIAVICGEVSGTLECIDFDSHDHDIDVIFEEWSIEQGIADIIERRKVYIEKSPRGGYHVLYRYEADGATHGNQVLSRWSDGTSMIETRGEGGYVIISPTPGYETIRNSILSLSQLTIEERDYLISYAKQFTQDRKKQEEIQPDKDEKPGYDHTDPVSWFNWNKAVYAKKLLEDKQWVKINDGKDGVENWRRPGKEDGISATWGYGRKDALYVFTSSVEYFKPNCYYTPFQILVRIRFNGNYNFAFSWIVSKFFSQDIPYIRVGTDYYKKIKKYDRFGLWRTELKAWKKDEIKQDEGAKYLDKIPRYDDFTIEPDNFNYQPVIKNCYNLYKEFTHKPEPGSWKWTRIMIEHIFGDQYDLGLRYLQALYLHPNHMLPILVLVSRQRQTGKTTFLNWLNMIFGDNMANIAPEDLAGSFNHLYATANIIAIEETLIEKSITVEKLKALATGKFISVNQKWVQQYKVPFFGKIILASNNEEKFAKIDEEEIRFFVRKINLPKNMNHGIEEDMRNEIPAFLHYLTTLPQIDWGRDRSGFTPDELTNEILKTIKHESKNWLYKEITEYMTDLFNNEPIDEVFATPSDIKRMWYDKNSRAEVGYIRDVIRLDFKLMPLPHMRYIPLINIGSSSVTKTGTPYRFRRETFTILSANETKSIQSAKEQIPVTVKERSSDDVKELNEEINFDIEF